MEKRLVSLCNWLYMHECMIHIVCFAGKNKKMVVNSHDEFALALKKNKGD